MHAPAANCADFFIFVRLRFFLMTPSTNNKYAQLGVEERRGLKVGLNYSKCTGKWKGGGRM